MMIWDGLRPDYVTPELTPRLHALAGEGVRFADSHAVFPTFTRCNSATLSTGYYPARHGIPGNRFAAQAIELGRIFNAAEREPLEDLRAHRGRLLHVDTVGDQLAAVGRMAAVLGTGSPGAALLQHPDVALRGHLMLHPTMWEGVDPAQFQKSKGPWPEKTRPNTEQNAYFTSLITEYLLPERAPSYISYWHTDPDHTAHAMGVGHPDTLKSIRDADNNLGIILDALDRLGLRGETDVIVVSDHGFSTITDALPVRTTLLEAGVIDDTASVDVLDADGGIYVRDHHAGTVQRVVDVLHRMPSVGSIFTGAHGNPALPGTDDLAVVGQGGELSPDILISGDWDSEENEHGYRGRAYGGAVRREGFIATHGSASPWDIKNTLIMSGPSFKRGLVSEAPAGNVDVAPTLRHTLGLPDTPADGRVLREALVGGPHPSALSVHREVSETASPDGRFRQRVHRSFVGDEGGAATAAHVDYVEADHT